VDELQNPIDFSDAKSSGDGSGREVGVHRSAPDSTVTARSCGRTARAARNKVTSARRSASMSEPCEHRRGEESR
jgi:hypothetical protein